MREKTAEEVYDEFTAQGEYKVIEMDIDIIKKMRKTALENAEYIEFLLKQKTINWRIVYALYYDVLRELCEALIRCDGLKISNHQGVFAYICVKHSQLDLDWNFFEKIRTMRNRNKYEASDISQSDWKAVELQMRLYVSTVNKALKI